MPEAPKELTGPVTVIKAMTEVGIQRWRRQKDDEWRGASVSSLDGDAADGIHSSHCEGGEVAT